MSYTALYRKWRPVSFEDVKGQDPIVQTLKNQITSERIGHAYPVSYTHLDVYKRQGLYGTIGRCLPAGRNILKRLMISNFPLRR